jgi:hypothetical protein
MLRGKCRRFDQGTRIEADLGLPPWRLAVRLMLMLIVSALSLVLICAGLSPPETPARILAVMGGLGLVAFCSWCYELVQWFTGSKNRFLNQFVRDALNAHA